MKKFLLCAAIVLAGCGGQPPNGEMPREVTVYVSTDGVLLLDARQRALLWNSTLLATATAVLATAIGAPL